MPKSKLNIEINVENCAQCLSCMLICSFTHFGTFNPSQAYIQISPGHFEDKVWIPTTIEFLEKCKPNCRLCVEYCAYDALKYVGGE